MKSDSTTSDVWMPSASLDLADAGHARGAGPARELKLENLSVTFGQVKALRDVSVQARAGEALMLIGPNGAGKSTLIRILLGLVRPDSGAIVVDGARVSVDRAFKEHLGYLPEAVAFSDNLTGRQVLRFFARARAVDKKRVDAVLDRVGLAKAAKRRVRGYSRGMRQRLGLGVSIISQPSLLVLDEPTGGLDQEGLGVLFDVLDEWRRAGRMVLVATHDLTLLERRVDRVCILESGRRIALDTPTALRETAALPVRVTLATRGDVTALTRAITDWGEASVTHGPGRLVVEVTPDSLMKLMDIRAQHADVVSGLRVEEPGMDEVYEHFLGASEEEVSR